MTEHPNVELTRRAMTLLPRETWLRYRSCSPTMWPGTCEA